MPSFFKDAESRDPSRLECVVLEIRLYSEQKSANRTSIKPQKKLTSFPKTAASFKAPIFSSPYSNPHSVNNNPGSTALHLTFLPCVFATHFTKCNCAAFVTLYAILDPPILRPAIELVTSTTPPSSLELKIGTAAAARAFTPRTLVFQHRSHSASERASRSAKEEKRVQPALAITMSRPPRDWVAVWTRVVTSAVEPASALRVAVFTPWVEESSEASWSAAEALLA
jgi:hypothetical protein